MNEFKSGKGHPLRAGAERKGTPPTLRWGERGRGGGVR